MNLLRRQVVERMRIGFAKLVQSALRNAGATRAHRPTTRIVGRSIWIAVVLHGFPGLAVTAQNTSTAQTVTLSEARLLARQNHPEILAARHAVSAAQGLERQSGAFPNPTLSFAREQTSTSGGTNWQNIVMFGQPIEIGGQRGARRTAARHRRMAAEEGLASVEAQVAFDVGRAYAHALAADARLAQTAEAAAIFSRAREISAQRFAEGDISGYENRRIGLEAARYAALEAEMSLARHEARLSLAALLAPTSDSVSILAAEIDLVDSIATPAIDESLDSLIALAFEHRADLRAVDLERDASVADMRLTSRQAFPTPTVALGFKNERAASDLGTSNGFALQVAFPLPLWDRHRGATDAARARTGMIDALRSDLRINIAREVEQAWSMLVAATEQLDVLRPLLGEEAQLALQAAATGYTEGEISLVEWLDAVRAYHEAYTSFATLHANHMIRFMTLERAVGSVLSEGTEQ